MDRSHREIMVSTFVLFAILCVSVPGAQGAVKSITVPGGGKIVYGEIDGQTTEIGAMNFILRSIHSQYGERPQVSTLFQVRGTQSVAAFFNGNDANQGGGQRTGLILVSKSATGQVEAAVVSDTASRFPANLQSMLKALTEAWRASSSTGGADASNGDSSPAAMPSMQTFVAQDHSASADFPQDWTPNPRSGQGTLLATGPNGEMVSLGVATLAGDTRNPSVQRTMMMVQSGQLRNTAYARGFYYPWNQDLTKMAVAAIQYHRALNNLPPATFQLDNESPLQAGQSQRCAYITGHADLQDGRGNRELSAILTVSPPGRFGGYMITAYIATVPVALAGQEHATIGAILRSYQINMDVFQREAGADAAPAIAAIHEVGRRAAMQAQAAHRAEDIHNAAVEQHWDDMDRSSKAFSDYLLDNSVVEDNSTGGHKTLSNGDAEALIREDPNRFEHVSTPNLQKGLDY